MFLHANKKVYRKKSEKIIGQWTYYIAAIPKHSLWITDNYRITDFWMTLRKYWSYAKLRGLRIAISKLNSFFCQTELFNVTDVVTEYFSMKMIQVALIRLFSVECVAISKKKVSSRWRWSVYVLSKSYHDRKENARSSIIFSTVNLWDHVKWSTTIRSMSVHGHFEFRIDHASRGVVTKMNHIDMSITISATYREAIV